MYYDAVYGEKPLFVLERQQAMNALQDNNIEQLRTWIKECPPQGLVFFGGAGVSTESGIPDFRSSNGLFNKHYPYPAETIVSHSFFEAYPDKFFEFYFDRMIAPAAQPNQAHKKLAQLEQQGICRAVITQNIDGLHQSAGSKQVYELHGSVHRNYCRACNTRYTLDEVIKRHNDASDGTPRCNCGGIIRPDVVLYEEALNDTVVQGATEAISQAELMIVAGTSLVVYPAAGLLQYFRGKHLAIINLQPTPADKQADLCITAKVGEVFRF